MLAICATTGSAVPAKKPLKVFILAAQSNMDEHAAVKTFASLVVELFTAKELKTLEGPSHRVHHYVGTAKIVGPIGKAFAEEIVRLQPGQKQK